MSNCFHTKLIIQSLCDPKVTPKWLPNRSKEVQTAPVCVPKGVPGGSQSPQFEIPWATFPDLAGPCRPSSPQTIPRAQNVSKIYSIRVRGGF